MSVLTAVVCLIALIILVEASGTTNFTPIHKMYPDMWTLNFDGNTAYRMVVSEPKNSFTIMMHIYAVPVELERAKAFWFIRAGDLGPTNQAGGDPNQNPNRMVIRTILNPAKEAYQIAAYGYENNNVIGPVFNNFVKDRWEHFAYVYDGSQVTFYKNGIKSKSSEGTLDPYTEYILGGVEGDNQGKGWPPGWFEGSFKNFTYLKDALSETDIAAAAAESTLFRPFSCQATITEIITRSPEE